LQIKEACKSGPVVLLPTHKSHIDYILLSFICFAHNLPLPHIIAGDNLMISVVGHFLKHAGALWIRRKFGADDLYMAVFQEYLCALLNRGAVLECFIEGTRLVIHCGVLVWSQ
jgi:glycerol-3-phosphate O-acyltransferase